MVYVGISTMHLKNSVPRKQGMRLGSESHHHEMLLESVLRGGVHRIRSRCRGRRCEISHVHVVILLELLQIG